VDQPQGVGSLELLEDADQRVGIVAVGLQVGSITLALMPFGW
jgi:hypothetical protein